MKTAPDLLALSCFWLLKCSHQTTLPPCRQAPQFTAVANFTSSGRGAGDGCEITLAFVAAKPPAESASGGDGR